MSEVGAYPNAAPLAGSERLLADQLSLTVDVTPAQLATYVLAQVVAGANITITTSGLGIEIAASGGGGGGGSGTVTSVGLTMPTGFTVSGSPVTASGTLSVSGTLSYAAGGTGLGTTPTAGQLLIGNGAGYTLAALTAGSGITITNSAGGISIAAASTPTTAFTTITTSTTLSPSVNAVLVDATSGNITVTLPTAVGANIPYIVKRKDATSHTVTIATTSSQTIDGATTVQIQFQYTSVTMVSDSSNWWVT